MNEIDTTKQIIQLFREFGPYGTTALLVAAGYLLPYARQWLELYLADIRERTALNKSRRILNEADAALARAALEANQTRGAAPSPGSPRSVRTSRHDADADLSAPEQR